MRLHARRQAAAAATSEGNYLRKRLRKRGHPSEQINFRCPEELVQAIDAEGEDRTDGLVVMLDRANDAKQELGDEWMEVVVFAHREGITEGQALGRLLKAAILKDRKKK